jgi:predicted DNA-binding transcriptional regulator AlpA
VSTNVTTRWATRIDIDVALVRGDGQSDGMIHDILGHLSEQPVRRDSHVISEHRPDPDVRSRDADLLPPLLTVRELAVLLATSRAGVYSRVARGQVPGVLHIGRILRFDRACHRTMALGEQCERRRSPMIKLRPWKGSKNEFEVDVIVNGPQGRTLRKRVKAPVTGKSNAERWARALEQEMLSQILAPEPEPEKPPAPTFEEFTAIFLDLCRANRLGVNTLMNYEIHLRHYLVPVLGKRRLDQISPSDITRIKSSLSAKSHNTACEVLKTLRRVFNVAIAQKQLTGEPVDLEIPRRLRKAVIAYDAAQQAHTPAVSALES